MYKFASKRRLINEFFRQMSSSLPILGWLSIYCQLKEFSHGKYNSEAVILEQKQLRGIASHLYGPSPIKAIRASGSLSMTLFQISITEVSGKFYYYTQEGTSMNKGSAQN